MFGKNKKLLVELTDKCDKLEFKELELMKANAKLEKANRDLDKRLGEANRELAKAEQSLARAARELNKYRSAFEGSLAGINSLLEDESLEHKRQTEFMRGLKEARAVLEVYVDADEDNT